MNANYSIKELIEDKEKLEFQIYEKLRDFQNKYDCNVAIELDTRKNENFIEKITDVRINIGV